MAVGREVHLDELNDDGLTFNQSRGLARLRRKNRTLSAEQESESGKQKVCMNPEGTKDDDFNNANLKDGKKIGISNLRKKLFLIEKN